MKGKPKSGVAHQGPEVFYEIAPTDFSKIIENNKTQYIFSNMNCLEH